MWIGVLNQEELAIVNSTYAKAEAGKLPRILEDIRKSSESNTTLDSDSWELENLEVDLFGDLRASIQRPVSQCDRNSQLVPSIKSACPVNVDTSKPSCKSISPYRRFFFLLFASIGIIPLIFRS